MLDNLFAAKGKVSIIMAGLVLVTLLPLVPDIIALPAIVWAWWLAIGYAAAAFFAAKAPVALTGMAEGSEGAIGAAGVLGLVLLVGGSFLTGIAVLGAVVGFWLQTRNKL